MSVIDTVTEATLGNDSSADQPSVVICVNNNWVNSQGIFVGDSPLGYSLPLLLLELSMMFLASTATHFFLRRIGQSRFVSHLIAGILLGPSVLSRSKRFRYAMFPIRGLLVLDTLSLISFLFFLFTSGVKTSLGLVRKAGRPAIAIGIFGSIFPFMLATTAYFLLRSRFPTDLQDGTLIINLAARLSLASFPVVADALTELKLLNSELGRLAVTSALITDILSWILSSAVGVYTLITLVEPPIKGVAVLFMVVAFALLLAFVVRPAALWVVKRSPPGELLGEGYFVTLMMMALIAAFMTELMGFHLALGPMLLGLVLPEGMPVGTTLTEKLEPLLIGLILPMYLVVAGFKTDFTKFESVKPWGALELVVILCYLGKLVGSATTAIYFKMPWKHAISVALMVNIKGIVEIYFINNWGNTEIASVEHFSVLTVSMLILTAVTTPLIKYIYDPSQRFVARKRRTIQHLKARSELRIQTCVHNEDQVAPILDLLEVSNAASDSPISLTVLHLTELSGTTASTVRTYKRSRHSHAPTATERIVNAFRYFEQQCAGAVSLHPFVAAAPYVTMHNDVCALALDRKSRLVILPFHKQSNGAQETANRVFQSINQNVMDFAPCSVAILVDRSIPAGSTCTRTNSLLNRIGVYFLGGADDREALAYASRMADSGNISLTVVRFLPRDEAAAGEDEAARKLDDQLIEAFQVRQAQNERMIYMEKLVENGEGTVAVMHDMSEKFDLLIVGRRNGLESAVTSGMEAWNESPELGIIGDMLESTEFSSKVSILVVQQQPCAGGRLGGGEDDNVGFLCVGGNCGGAAAGQGQQQRGGGMNMGMRGMMGSGNQGVPEIKDNLIRRENN